MHSLLHMIWGAGKHVAFGYLVYSLIEHSRGSSPTAKKTIILFFGVLFPDVVDKSLVLIGVLDYGRSFAHSLIVASVLIGVVCLFANLAGYPELGYTFGLGYLLHIPVDLYGPLLTGNNPIDTAFLFWPVVTEHPLGVMPLQPPIAKNTVFSMLIISALTLLTYDVYQSG